MTATRTASRTARERARAELTAEIKAEARRQLASHGSQQLSLRAVARELGMASSAIYRYFASRDDLLTALIIDAYDSLGAAAEDADRTRPRTDISGRWLAVCSAARAWALARPYEYALIYGSPVPGYHAPRTTIGPAARVAVVFGQILSDLRRDQAGNRDQADEGERTAGPRQAAGPLPPVLAGQAAALAAAIAPRVPAPVVARTLIAWTQLFGMISFELFGQLTGVTEPADEFFAYAVGQMAAFVGLP